MSIRPLDMQIMIPKSSEISNIKQNLNNKSQNEQYLINHDFRQKTEIKNKQIIGPNENGKLHLNTNEDKKESQQKHNRENNNKDRKKQKKNKSGKFENNHIDIKI